MLLLSNTNGWIVPSKSTTRDYLLNKQPSYAVFSSNLSVPSTDPKTTIYPMEQMEVFMSHLVNNFIYYLRTTL